jgi:MinD-like ATPase involved in chromosome partitioning or flagellar assembly
LIITLHSYKGGTGKTLLSLNLAAILAKLGKKVCLFDFDLRAPSLFSILKVERIEYWLNDYLNSACEIGKVVVDLSSRVSGNGRFCSVFANPATEAIRDILNKSSRWEMRALEKLLSLRNTMLNDQEFNYLVFDTSPGLQYSSINAIVAADFVIVATTSDRSDVDGTQRMLRELYGAFGTKTGLVFNKVLDSGSKLHRDELGSRVKEVYRVPLLGLVPCFCEIMRAKGNSIFVEKYPNHPFARTLQGIAKRINPMAQN